MKKWILAFVFLFSVSGFAQSIQAPPGGITTPTVVGKATVTVDDACTAGQYWIRPVAGALNSWRVCNNGTVANINSGGSSGLSGFQTATSTIQAAVTAACAASPQQGVFIPPNYAGTDISTNPCGATIFDVRTLGVYRGGIVSVRDFFADGTGGWYPQVQCNSNTTLSNVFISSGRAPKVGDAIVVAGCGAAGADLSAHITGGTATTGTIGGTIVMDASASISGINHGARWANNNGSGIDDTTAFNAAFAYCGSLSPSGCTALIPGGTFFLNNATTPNAGSGRLTIRCAGSGRNGLGATNLVGIGADQTDIIHTPVTTANSITVENCAFVPWDYNHATQIAIHLRGGVYHEVMNNSATNVYEFVRAEGVTENTIEYNRIFPKVNGIHFGPTSFVTASTVAHNSIGSGFSNVGILVDNSSQQNTYYDNTIQQDNPPFAALVDLDDSASVFIRGYEEFSNNPTSGFAHIFRGQAMSINMPYYACEWNAGANTTWVVGIPTATCNGQTYSIHNTANGMLCMGCSAASNDNSTGQVPSYYSRLDANVEGAFRFIASDLTGTGTKISTMEWKNGAGSGAQLQMGYTIPNNTNPTTPSTPSGATFSMGTVIWNRLTNNAVTDPVFDPAVAWACISGPCVSNGTGYSSGIWAEIGFVRKRTHREGTAAPGSGTWTAGDFIWNTSPTTGILGWLCTTGGTPGTWLAVYDWASPQALGATTPNTGKFTTINYTSGLQHNGTALQVSDLSDGANVVTQTSNASSGQVCTYTGANKICVPATALPNGITATTQSPGDNSTKAATTAYADAAAAARTGTIASGTSAMGTSAIASGACATVVTTAATGTATTDTIQYTPNADPTGVTGYAVSATGSLYIWAYPTANNVNFKVCNNTSGSLTPGALTLNWRVVR